MLLVPFAAVLPSKPTSVKPTTSVVERSSRTLFEPQQSSSTIFPSPTASFQPSETVEASRSHGIETMSTMPSATTSVTGGRSGAPAQPLPFHYLLLISCLCAAVFVGLLLSTVCLLLCCIKSRRRKNKRGEQ